jgi:flagellum-specific peptidoglycan hydrolase FlgJ
MTYHESYHETPFQYKRNRGQNGNNFKETLLLWQILFIAAMIFIFWNDKVSIVIHSNKTDQANRADRAALLSPGSIPAANKSTNATPKAQTRLEDEKMGAATHFIDPEFAARHHTPRKTVEARTTRCSLYLEKYASLAVEEMRRSGIPASIILAQGLLESDAGASNLAKKLNNHFGVKCFSKKCGKKHCQNFTDDSHKDFFVHYPGVWSSYRAHTQFLVQNPRYHSLFKQGATSYHYWAKGLQQAGYATDPRYARKLITLIQNLQLDQYDSH